MHISVLFYLVIKPYYRKFRVYQIWVWTLGEQLKYLKIKKSLQIGSEENNFGITHETYYLNSKYKSSSDFIWA